MDCMHYGRGRVDSVVDTLITAVANGKGIKNRTGGNELIFKRIKTQAVFWSHCLASVHTAVWDSGWFVVCWTFMQTWYCEHSCLDSALFMYAAVFPSCCSVPFLFHIRTWLLPPFSFMTWPQSVLSLLLANTSLDLILGQSWSCKITVTSYTTKLC